MTCIGCVAVAGTLAEERAAGSWARESMCGLRKARARWTSPVLAVMNSRWAICRFVWPSPASRRCAARRLRSLPKDLDPGAGRPPVPRIIVDRPVPRPCRVQLDGKGGLDKAAESEL